MLEDLELFEEWKESERKYLDKKLEGLVGKSKILDNGCIVHKIDTPGKDHNIEVKSTSLNIPKKSIILSNSRFVALCVYGSEMLDQIVRHKCKTKRCYNYNHIELGTILDNALDRHRDGTMGAKLTKEQVIKIYKNKKKLSYRELARKYGVGKTTIANIFTGITWSEITGQKKRAASTNTKAYVKKTILKDKEKYIDRIKSSIEIDSESNCWLWQKYCNPDGYGIISILSSTFNVHSVMCSIENDRFPEKDEVIRHSCINKSCCQPKHLSFGSHSDNMKDRKLFGEKTSNAKLTEKEVLEIVDLLAEGKSGPSIAKIYGIGYGAVYNIRDGKTWGETTGIKKNAEKRSKKLNLEDIADIKFILQLGKFSQAKVALQYDTSNSTVNRIYNGLSHSDIEVKSKLSDKGKSILNKLKEGNK